MKYISLLISCFFIVSCGNAKNSTNSYQPEPLSGIYKISKVGETALSSADVVINFAIEKNTVSGFSGCNQFSGSYEYQGSSLNFGPLASTRKMCLPEANHLEKQITTALQNTKQYSETQKNILLYNQEGSIVMTLEKPLKSESETKVGNLENYQLEYLAVSRGSFIMIRFENNSLSFQKDRNSKPQVLDLSETEVASLHSKVNKLNLNTFTSLEPPTKAHQYDGAAGATLKLTENDVTHQTPTFDHGNPPNAIEALVSELIALSEKP